MAEQSLFESFFSVIWILFFVGFFMYGQKIQGYIMILKVRKHLKRLEIMKISSRDKLLKKLGEYTSQPQAIEEKVDRAINSFMISPISIDPKGIVPKLGYLSDTYDDSLKSLVKIIAPKADNTRLMNLTNLTEVTIGLNNMYRIVRHFYLLGKKPGGLLSLTQLQFVLPSIMDSAEAYHSSIDAFSKGLSIGDSFGPLVVSELQKGLPVSEIVKDTLVSDMDIEGRKVFLVKAKGPGGNVGKPGKAIEKIFEGQSNVKLVITIDAALKFEGEQTGQVAEGIGAAIGGLGVERYQIEESSTKASALLYAIVVKMSEKEAITQIKQEIIKNIIDVKNRVKRIIKDKTKTGDYVIVAGIGNTIGVA